MLNTWLRLLYKSKIPVYNVFERVWVCCFVLQIDRTAFIVLLITQEEKDKTYWRNLLYHILV